MKMIQTISNSMVAVAIMMMMMIIIIIVIVIILHHSTDHKSTKHNNRQNLFRDARPGLVQLPLAPGFVREDDQIVTAHAQLVLTRGSWDLGFRVWGLG